MEKNSFINEDLSPKSATFFIYDSVDYKDRAFKHVSFSIPAEIKKDEIRLKLITKDGNEKEIKSKKIDIPIEFSYTYIPKFRIKSISNPSIHFINETDLNWVEQKNEKKIKNNFNQFRVKGISNIKKTKSHEWKSDWIYSNLKDFNNETVIFELLNEFMDLIIKEKDIEIVLNSFVHSCVTALNFEEKMHFYITLEAKDKYCSVKKEKNLFLDIDWYLKNFFIGAILDRNLDIMLDVIMNKNKLNSKIVDQKPVIQIQKLLLEYINLFRYVKETLKIERDINQIKETKNISLKYSKKILKNNIRIKNELRKITLKEKNKQKNIFLKLNEKRNLKIKEIKKTEKFKIKSIKENKNTNYKEYLINKKMHKTMSEKKLNIIIEKIKNKKNDSMLLKEIKKNKIRLKIEFKTNNLKKNEEKLIINKKENIYNIIEKHMNEMLSKKIKESNPIAYEEEKYGVVLGAFVLGLDYI